MTFPKIKTKHLGIYHYTQTPQEMVRAGRKKGYSYFKIGRELSLEAIRLKNSSPIKSIKYKRGAKLAFLNDFKYNKFH
jgi:histidinol phosphatase-like PHP family hydrolase